RKRRSPSRRDSAVPRRHGARRIRLWGDLVPLARRIEQRDSCDVVRVLRRIRAYEKRPEGMPNENSGPNRGDLEDAAQLGKDPRDRPWSSRRLTPGEASTIVGTRA